MTHEKLLAKINSYLTSTKALNINNNFAVSTLEALRAVVELHKPKSFLDYEWGEIEYCGHCEMNPCPTIQAIEKELK